MTKWCVWCTPLLLWFGAASALGDEAADHLIAGGAGDTIVPRASAASRRTVFVAGQTPSEELNGSDAALVARRGFDGSERWSVVAGDPDTAEYFTDLEVKSGKLCATGIGLDFEPFPSGHRLLVACYHSSTGKLLWWKDVPLPDISDDPSIELARRVVTVNVPTFSGLQVFAFRLSDGS